MDIVEEVAKVDNIGHMEKLIDNALVGSSGL